MKIRGLALGCAAVLCGLALWAQEPLSNESVLKMVRAGLSEEVIVGMIDSQPGKYSISTDEMIKLKAAGVPDKVIAAMVRRSTGQPAQPGSASTAATSEPLVLHEGTPVRMRLSRQLSSAEANTGETVDFEVLDELKIEDVVVIARGARANGTVTNAEHKKRMGRGGKLDVTIDYVRLINDDKVALRGVQQKTGGSHTGAMTGGMVATALVVWPAAPFFLFMHGKDVVIPKGTEVTAYTDSDVRLNRQQLVQKQSAIR